MKNLPGLAANNTTVLKILSGPFLFALAVIIIPDSVMPYSIRGALGLFLWMSAWWIKIPVSVAVTALLPIALTAVFGFVKPTDIIPQYFTDLVVLLIGADILTQSWETTGLNRRLALTTLSLVGPSMKSQMAMWFIASVAMSIFLPNVVVAATLTPIALAMLKTVNRENPSEHLSAANILLAIAWGAGIGGFGSPLGGGMNLIVIKAIESVTGQEYIYTDWVVVMLPILIIITIANILYMFTMKSEISSLPGAKDYFIGEHKKLGKMSKTEKLSLWMFLLPVILAFSREAWKGLLPFLTAPYIFMAFGIASFLLPGTCDGRLVTWKFVQPKLSWGLFYTLSGGLALGKVIIVSGATDMLANLVTHSGVTNPTILSMIFIVFVSILANVSSNNSACAITTPLVLSVMTAIGENPIPHLYMMAIGGNLAYLLPNATRAIPVDVGVKPSYMLRKGFVINAVSVGITMLLALVCLRLPLYGG
ncbi:MAG: SLC13 family permease [Sphaerochaetaceae bacterium]|nr:SLC13 family permease [Sphaerochaetaceae bacterium]